MMRGAVAARPSALAGAARDPSEGRLLDIDAAAFRAGFDRRPFLIRHRLRNHPLFALPRLLELARVLPGEDIEYNAGDLPMSIASELTPQTGLSVEETIRRIAECRSWMVLKRVEHDPAYRELLQRCLAEVREFSEPLRPGMHFAQGFIFLSSPGAVTPYHMDPEHNFLLQIRGTKRVRQWDPRDRGVVSERDLERFYAGARRNMVLDDALRAKAAVIDLEPGFGLHFPVTAPHWVQNGPDVSLSFSITFRTPDLERRSVVHSVNGYLRRRGWEPSPFGLHPWRDSLKYTAFRSWRRARRLLGASREV
jgi:hypothetical protein